MLSDALEVLGLAMLTVTTYIGFGIVPAGYVAAVCLLFIGWSLSSGRPEKVPLFRGERNGQGGFRIVRKADGHVLTNGAVDREALKG